MSDTSHRIVRFMLQSFPPLLIVAILPNLAMAAIPSDNLLEGILEEYRTKAGLWEPAIRRAALNLFWLLAGIEFAWTGISLALKGADLKEFAAEVVRQLLFIGFFLALLLNAAPWSRAIIDSLRQTAASANLAAGGTAGMSPSDIFDIGIDLSLRLADAYSIWRPGASIGLAIAALLIAITFALIAAFLVLAFVEMYLVLSAGIILLGLGGSRWTRDFAVRYLTYAFSVGMKLFVLQLLIGLGEAFIRDWSREFSNDQGQVFLVVGASIVMLALVKAIPDLIQSMITGMSTGSGTAITATAAAVAGGTAFAAQQGAGGAGAVYQAARLAQAQGATGPLGVASAAIGNLVQAAKEDTAGKMAGLNRHGSMGGRIAYHMRQERQSMGNVGHNTISGATLTGSGLPRQTNVGQGNGSGPIWSTDAHSLSPSASAAARTERTPSGVGSPVVSKSSDADASSNASHSPAGSAPGSSTPSAATGHAGSPPKPHGQDEGPASPLRSSGHGDMPLRATSETSPGREEPSRSTYISGVPAAIQAALGAGSIRSSLNQPDAFARIRQALHPQAPPIEHTGPMLPPESDEDDNAPPAS